MPSFQHRNARMTLAEGLAEYYSQNPFLKRGSELGDEAAAFFRCHDAVHVVYGCGTSLRDELKVKLSSILGTTGGLSVLRGYALHDSMEIYKKIPLAAILATLFAAIWIVPITVTRCLRQRKRWSWSGFDGMMKVPLHDIREDFCIRF